VYFHAGGWTFGMPEFGEVPAEVLVKELGFTVVSVGYRYAPEHVFPTAAHDAIDAVKWVGLFTVISLYAKTNRTFQCAENAKSLGANPSKGFILGGTSAGGNLAAVSAHQAIDDKLIPKITGVVLMYASLCHPEAIPEEYKAHISSWKDHRDGLVLDGRGLEWFLDNYRPDAKSPLMSPLIWNTHEGQPPTYLQIMG
jgi:acetyl esterase/lipase